MNLNYQFLKYLLFLSLFFVCNSGFCQDGYLPLDEHKQVFYSDVATVQKTKDEIFKSAQNWVTQTFGNYENAVTQQDLQLGKLVITSYVPATTSLYDYVRFELTIDCSDKQYRVMIDKLDGISQIRTPARLGVKENDAVLAKEVIMKSETNRKKRAEAEEGLQHIKADNDAVNNAMYKLLAGLKQFIVTEDEH